MVREPSIYTSLIKTCYRHSLYVNYHIDQVVGFDLGTQEIITGEVPYAGRPESAVMYAVTVKRELPSRPESTHGALWFLLEACWAFRPSFRLDASDIVRCVSHFVLNRKKTELNLS